MNDSSDFAKLSAIVASSGDAIISTDFNGFIQSWNNGAAYIFGFSSDEVLGKNINTIIPKELIEEEKSFVEELKGSGEAKNYETIRKRKDSTKFPVAITMSPIRDAETNVTGVSVIARDITKLKISQRNNSLLASIIKSSDDAIISKNLDGIITSWNPGAKKIYGFSAQEAIGKNISLIIPASRLEEEKQIISKVIKGKKVDHLETIRKTKDGNEINISLTVSPVKDASGRIIGASKVARDITERVEIEKQKQLFIDKLQQLNDFKDDFMMMASHELKTPITVMRACLQVLHDFVSEGAVDIRFVDKSLANLDKLSNLVVELLDVSKIQNGKLELSVSTFNLFVLLEEVASEMQQINQEHKIILRGQGELLEIKADRDKIKRVLINMITNAVKYSPGENKVVVETVVKQSGVIVKVKDNGIGIPKEDIDKVFNRFFRAGGRASTFPGVGIGLYISSEIIRYHGGKMWVENNDDKGSIFYIELPQKSSNVLSEAV